MNTPLKKPSLRNTMIAFVLVELLFFILVLVLPSWRVPIGITARLTMAVFCFVISAWMFRVQRSILGGILVLIVGLIGFVTALMGYGFNGTPPQPWLFS